MSAPNAPAALLIVPYKLHSKRSSTSARMVGPRLLCHCAAAGGRHSLRHVGTVRRSSCAAMRARCTAGICHNKNGSASYGRRSAFSRLLQLTQGKVLCLCLRASLCGPVCHSPPLLIRVSVYLCLCVSVFKFVSVCLSLPVCLSVRLAGPLDSA